MVTLTVCNPNQKKVAEDLERQARGEPEPAKGNEMHLFIYLFILTFIDNREIFYFSNVWLQLHVIQKPNL